jgi:hypothetical protein
MKFLKGLALFSAFANSRLLAASATCIKELNLIE